jgi:hypothetical protein
MVLEEIIWKGKKAKRVSRTGGINQVFYGCYVKIYRGSIHLKRVGG